MVEAGMYDEALKHLDEYDEQIVDKLAVEETKGMFSHYTCVNILDYRVFAILQKELWLVSI
jgi:hypothetical protein